MIMPIIYGEYDTFSANIILNYYRRIPRRSCEVLCERGTYFVDLLKNEITFNNEVIFSSNQKIIDTYTAQMEFFVTEILNKKNQFNTIQEAYKLLKLCLNS